MMDYERMMTTFHNIDFLKEYAKKLADELQEYVQSDDFTVEGWMEREKEIDNIYEAINLLYKNL